MTDVALAAIEVFGHCPRCGLSDIDCLSVERLIEAGRAIAMRRHPACEHVLIYRSVGLWTAFLKAPATEALREDWV